MRGRFITLEGLDGAGKSMQLGWLTRFIEAQGFPLRVTREPGGTPLGETLRALLLDGRERLHAETETLLMFAARREHLEQVISPALDAGTWVLCDRFTDASFAYQGGGSGVDWHKLEMLEDWVHDNLQPDLTFYLDVNPEVGRARTTAIKVPDRYEREQQDFHARARAAYLRRAVEHPARIKVVDANRSMPDVQGELESLISVFCAEAASPLARTAVTSRL